MMAYQYMLKQMQYSTHKLFWQDVVFGLEFCGFLRKKQMCKNVGNINPFLLMCVLLHIVLFSL